MILWHCGEAPAKRDKMSAIGCSHSRHAALQDTPCEILIHKHEPKLCKQAFKSTKRFWFRKTQKVLYKDETELLLWN